MYLDEEDTSGFIQPIRIESEAEVNEKRGHFTERATQLFVQLLLDKKERLRDSRVKKEFSGLKFLKK